MTWLIVLNMILYLPLILIDVAVIYFYLGRVERGPEQERAKILKTEIIDYKVRNGKGISIFKVYYNTSLVKTKEVKIGSSRHKLYIELLEEYHHAR